MDSKKWWSQRKGDPNRVEELLQWTLEQVRCRSRGCGRQWAFELAEA